MSIEVARHFDAVLLCGGKGSRLHPMTHDEIPKSLYQVAGHPLIEYTTEVLRPDISPHLILAVGHHADMMQRWVQDAHLPHQIDFTDPNNEGVLDSIRSGQQFIHEDGVVLGNTDEIRDGLDLSDVVRFHTLHKKAATIVAAYTNNLSRHRILNVDPLTGKVFSTRLKPEEYRARPELMGLVNTGLILLEGTALEQADIHHSHGWSGLIDPLCDAGQLVAYVHPELHYFNVGTPEELTEAQTFLSTHPR